MMVVVVDGLGLMGGRGWYKRSRRKRGQQTGDTKERERERGREGESSGRIRLEESRPGGGLRDRHRQAGWQAGRNRRAAEEKR